MNLQFNTKVAVKANNTKKMATQKKSSKGTSEGNFSFNFSNSMKVKAVVARKRPVQKNEKNASNQSNKEILVTQQTDKVNQNKSKNVDRSDPVPTDSKVKSNEFNKNIDKNFDESTDGNLSLNIVTGSSQDYIKAKAKVNVKRLTKKQRQNAVLEKRVEAFKKLESSGKLPTIANVVKEPKLTKPTTKPIRQENKEKSNFQPPPLQPNAIPTQNKFKFKKKNILFKNIPEIPTIESRSVKPIQEQLFTGASLTSLSIHPHIVKNMKDLHYITELTHVQQRTIPVALSGCDVMVRSQTGSGKTLAYALPIVQKLQEMRPKITRNSGILALIIVPTRELAIQTYELFVGLLKPFMWIVPSYIVGGDKRKAEKARLRKGINIIIGTPGRLCDHLLHTESFKLDKVKWVVLDEADRLYEMGYEKDVKKIIDSINGNDEKNNSLSDFDLNSQEINAIKKSENNVQTLLLSATLTPQVYQLAGLALKNPTYIDVANDDNMNIEKCRSDEMENIVIPVTVSQTYILVPPKLRLVTLSGLLAVEGHKSKILIFLATEELVSFHHDLMVEVLTRKVADTDDVFNSVEANDSDVESADDDEIDDLIDSSKFHGAKKAYSNDEPLLPETRFFKLHGSLTQQERTAIFKEFKNAKTGVLLTTDVAARGIDVPMVDLVVQFSPPRSIADYVHRVGRTARAGRKGRAVMFLAPNESELITLLEDKRVKISQDNYNSYLKGVIPPSSFGTMENCAVSLKRKFEDIISEDEELKYKACMAFGSWIKFLAAFPRDFRRIFNVKNAHMGHYATSLGLQEPPKSLTKDYSAPKPEMPKNRLTYIDRTVHKRPFSTKLTKYASGSVTESTSEFASGLPPSKKKKMK